MFNSPVTISPPTPFTVLTGAQAQNVQQTIASQEKDLTSQLPIGTVPPTTSPSALFQKYVDTGDTIFKQAAGHALDALTQTVQQAPKAIMSGISNASNLAAPLLATTVKAENTSSALNPTKPATPQAPEPKPTFKEMTPQEQESILDRIPNAIAANETSIVKGDKYSSSQYSGVPTLGRALGKYRVTEGELAAYAPKFLGEPVSPQQFLATPALQDEYIKNKAKYYLDQDYSPEQFADIHNKGIQHESTPGSTLFQNPQYVKNFDANFLNNGN